MGGEKRKGVGGERDKKMTSLESRVKGRKGGGGGEGGGGGGGREKAQSGIKGFIDFYWY